MSSLELFLALGCKQLLQTKLHACLVQTTLNNIAFPVNHFQIE